MNSLRTKVDSGVRCDVRRLGWWRLS